MVVLYVLTHREIKWQSIIPKHVKITQKMFELDKGYSYLNEKACRQLRKLVYIIVLLLDNLINIRYFDPLH